jgi:hypothetical protein
VHRFENLFENSLERKLPYGNDVSDMVRIHSQGLVSFCTGPDFEFAMSLVSACE